MARARATTILSLALALLALGSGAGAGGSSAATTATSLGPNVIVFDPSMPVGADPGDRRRDPRRSRSTTRWAPTATRSCSSRAPTAPPTQPLQIKVGYYTEVAGLGASPTDVDDQRQGRGLQPLPRRRRHEQLPRAGQLLAHAVQPDAQRQRAPGRTAAAPRRTSGRSRRRCRCAASTSPAPTSR